MERIAMSQEERDRLEWLKRELGIGWNAAYSPQAKGRIERSFFTDQDRLIKLLRLAQVSTLEGAKAFLETEYWPEWNERFARPVSEFPNHHRPLHEHLDLSAILCHVEPRVSGNDYAFSFAGQRYQIAGEDVQAGMRQQRLRVELRLNGNLKARYQGRYLNIAECATRALAAKPAVLRSVRKDHNAGGESSWMQGFFGRPSSPLWKLIQNALYRPFTKRWLFFDRIMNEEVYQWPNISGRVIWVKVGPDWPFFALMSDLICDLLPQGGSQCFPLSHLSDSAVARFRQHCSDESITKEDVFITCTRCGITRSTANATLPISSASCRGFPSLPISRPSPRRAGNWRGCMYTMNRSTHGRWRRSSPRTSPTPSA